ncbi:MAG: BatD family protein [Ignavibacteriaceae bacterium]
MTKIFLISVILFFGGLSYAQSFTASVNNATVGLNDQFEVDFIFNGKDINGVRNLTPPNFSNFLVLTGPNQSSSMQIINGAVSGSLTFSYVLQPKSLGKFTIGKAYVE